MAAGSSSLTKNDYIDLVHGKFDQTNATDLIDAFQTFAASGTNHLAVFFHGGLVKRADAMTAASRLIGGYRGAGAYPFFFIWNSDLWTALRRLLSPFADDLAIRRVVQRHLIFIAQQMREGYWLNSEQREILSDIIGQPHHDVPPSLEELARLGRAVDGVWRQRPDGATLPPVVQVSSEIQRLEDELYDDKILIDVHRWLNQRKRFTPQLGASYLWRVWARLNSGHDHGLYTTLIEETVISLGLHRILIGLWHAMQDDIDAAFRTDPAAFGGTAFLDELARVWNSGTRLTLIGHSGGTVYINRMLNALDDRFASGVQADIVFIAAALSCEVFAETVDRKVFERRVHSYRCFALDDYTEGNYWEVPHVYDKSLLYLHSALCEGDREADKPLVGMQRYWSGKPPYDVPDLEKVTDAIKTSERVWSPTAMTEPDGHRSQALHHGDFALDTEADLSVRHFLRYG